MKLAEALHQRADLQKRIAQLGTRLNNNAKVQEGDEPSEDPLTLLAALDAATKEYGALIAAVNRTNAAVRTPDGRTLTDLIARKDTLSLHISILRGFLDAASARVDRYSNKEIRIVSTIDVRAQQKALDALSAELREIDVTIQGLNWTTDLLE